MRDRHRSLAFGMVICWSPLSSAIRKEHPFGCSFLICEVAGFGSGLRDRWRSLAIGLAI